MGIALMGGTFDPVHVGHLRSAVEIAALLELSSVRLVPSYIPPHRSLPGTTATQRLEMLRLATRCNAQIEIDEREVRREGRSYTIDTLSEIREEIGTKEPLYFVVGIDAFQLIETWHRWQELTEYAHLIVINRPEATGLLSDKLNTWVESRREEMQALQRSAAGMLCQVELTQLAISSTQIRMLVAAKRSTKYLLPESVRRYIDAEGLYAG